MLVLRELWIGDEVQLIKSGRVGKFEGQTKDGKARINIEGKIVKTKAANLQHSKKDTSSVEPLHFQESTLIEAPFESTIDLHIEKLNPALQHSRPERIIDFQVKAATKQIETAIEKNVLEIMIIHGKGAGVLKSEIMHLLSLYDEVKHLLPANNNGAVVVMF